MDERVGDVRPQVEGLLGCADAGQRVRDQFRAGAGHDPGAAQLQDVELDRQPPQAGQRHRFTRSADGVRQAEGGQQCRPVGLADLAAIIDAAALVVRPRGQDGELAQQAGTVGGDLRGEGGGVGQPDGWELCLLFAAAVAGTVGPGQVFHRWHTGGEDCDLPVMDEQPPGGVAGMPVHQLAEHHAAACRVAGIELLRPRVEHGGVAVRGEAVVADRGEDPLGQPPPAGIHHRGRVLPGQPVQFLE